MGTRQSFKVFAIKYTMHSQVTVDYKEFSLFTTFFVFEVKSPCGKQFPRNLEGKISPIYFDLPMVYLFDG